jgi:hypothetical protein
MDVHVKHAMTRRTALAVLGVGLLLPGCQSSGRRRKAGWEPLYDDDPLLRPAPGRDPGVPGADPGYRGGPSLASLPSGVTPRRQWASAGVAVALADPMVAVRRITVHHDGMPPVRLASRGDVADRLELIRRAHRNRGWADIGYHFAIDPQGNVWEGRPLVYQGAHVRDYNERNLGVLVLGNFDEQRPTREALDALDAFVSAQMSRFNIPLREVRTHQEFSITACPGRTLQRHMLDARSSRGALARA